MEPTRVSPEVQEALQELSQYLSDTMPPMMVAGAVELLATQPPVLVAEQIRGWTAAQYQGRSASLPVSDYLFHALKKLHLLAELKLVPTDKALRLLGGILPLLETFCPEEDRGLLRDNVSRLGSAATTLTSPVETIYRQVGSEQPLASRGRPADPPGTGAAAAAAAAAAPAVSPGPHATTDDVARGLARFGLLVERLEKSLPKEGSKRPSDALTAQLLATAATASRSSRELEENLARLSRMGVDVPSGDGLFRKLSESLPGWGVPVNPDADETIGPGARGSVVGAMRRLVTLAPDAEEGAKRFREMVQAGVEQFNEGNLGRAVTLFGLAEQVIRRERVEKTVAQAMRARSHETLDAARMRTYAEKPENHFGLKTILDFFPALRPGGLLDSLREERKRDGRRLLLSLLEVHGPSARDAALEKLSVAASLPAGETDWYFLRNLLYVLRRVPRTTEAPSDAEVDFLFRLSEPSLPPPLVKEALANLGQARHERAGQILVARLSQLESTVAKAGAVVPADLLQLLDKTCAALARQATPATLRAIVDHGLKGSGAASGSVARLGHLGGHDLSPQEELVDRLLKALRSALPVKVLGIVLASSASADGEARHLVKALSGTPVPSVQRLFEDVARKYPDKEFGREARKALSFFEQPRKGAEAPGPASLTGDLEVFGLPTLLQTLEQTQATGLLTLRDGRGTEIGGVAFEGGKVRGAASGTLRGIDAFHQLLERPAAASFAFARAAALRPEDVNLSAPQAVMGLLLEGMRRYDELQRSAALIPDGARLRSTGTKPTRPPQEDDPKLLSAIWTKVSQGATAAECEAMAATDAFRVRRLLVHWVEEGSLQVLPE